MSDEHRLTDASFSSAVERIMELLVDAGFQNVGTSITLIDHYGELSFFDDEASRLLRIIRLGLMRTRTGPIIKNRQRVRFPRALIDAVAPLALEEGVTPGSWIRYLVRDEVERRKAGEA